MGTVIGIHLGRKARVGAIKDGQVTVLTDRWGADFFTPYVGVFKGRPGTGRDEMAFGGTNMFQDVMAISRQRAEDAGVFKATSLDITPPNAWYKAKVTDEIRGLSNGTEYTFMPDEIYAPLLAELRDIAEAHIGPNITGAVVTIPPFFTDTDREHLERAGERIGLPIVRQMHETTSMIISLGLDDLSYEEERYTLHLEIERIMLYLSILEIDMGLVDRVATIKTNLLFRRDEVRPVLDQLLHRAALTPNKITDLIISTPGPTYNHVQRSIKEYLPNARIANTPLLETAGVWGATLVSGWMSGEGDTDWIPCCCSTRRPPIGVYSVGDSDDAWVEILSSCQTLPAYQKASLNIPCEEEIATVKIYMRDVPCLDYHAMYEMGDLYVPEAETTQDVFLGEFAVPASCNQGSAKIEVEVLMTRKGALKIRGVDLESGKVGKESMLTIEKPHFACGDALWSADMGPANYTVSVGEDLDLMYNLELKGFVGLDKEQKPVDAFVEFKPLDGDL
ncbi:Hsp70 protein-domain-containing protein [Aspergillus multicolor]|uniref:Hsp70 protein-domain-containing protein n=1 Tax=Aspergillus multicolor TaxID=41759 RepID=UPI003CCD8FA0